MSTRSDRKRSCNDKLSSPIERFCSGEKLFRTRLEVLLHCKLDLLPFEGVARGGCENSTASALPPSPCTVSPPRMEVLVNMFCFQYGLDGRRFLSMALDEARPHVMIQNSCLHKAVGACVHRTAMWDRCNWQWIPVTFYSVSADMPFIHCRKKLPYLRSLFKFMRFASMKTLGPWPCLAFESAFILFVGQQPILSNLRLIVSCAYNKHLLCF